MKKLLLPALFLGLLTVSCGGKKEKKATEAAAEQVEVTVEEEVETLDSTAIEVADSLAVEATDSLAVEAEEEVN